MPSNALQHQEREYSRSCEFMNVQLVCEASDYFFLSPLGGTYAPEFEIPPFPPPPPPPPLKRNKNFRAAFVTETSTSDMEWFPKVGTNFEDVYPPNNFSTLLTAM